MLSFALCLSFLLHLFAATLAATPAYNATVILLDCGSQSTTTDSSSRSWDGDERSKYAPENITATSSSSVPANQQAPYTTARIFKSPFTYNFPVTAGPKFLRLHFYSATYSESGLNETESFFSVTANDFTLLSNFSAYLTSVSTRPKKVTFTKEFMINVENNQRLNITFSPSPNSYGFINGIEIVSMPDTLYFRGNDVPIKFVDQVFYLTNTTALQTLYRLNVGGGANVEIQEDTGMYRGWFVDDDYISGDDLSYRPHVDNASIIYTKTPAYTAPQIVYTTSRVIGNNSNRLDWSFEVDSGFHYLLRFHFCEIQLEVTDVNQRVFTIYVNNQIADIEVDVITLAGGRFIPIFKDYVAWVSDNGSRGKRDLPVSLLPYTAVNPKYNSSVLNGLEIFKLNDMNRSLAAANPEPLLDSPPPDRRPGKKAKSKGSALLFSVIGGVTGVLLVLAFVCFLIHRRRQRVKDSGLSAAKSSWVPLSTTSKSTVKTSASGSSLPSDLCRHFLLEEIRSATGNFDDNFIIGMGGFGKVYKGYINNGATTVAIKRLNPSSNQGAREFETEIQMLSKLRHLHLVSLIGYCDENGEMILVYDYMAHGTLRDHLYKTGNAPLTWKQRLQICIGSAKGLHYLHTGAKHMIIHRDVKSTNILLDEKWVAKVSDFGLSKVGPTGGANTHVSTVVKGSFGYVDPEYYRRQQLTDKSDVYSFGVVLFEVLCARPPIIPNLPKMQVNLAEWAKFCNKKGTLEQIVDPNLEGQIAPECLNKFVEIAHRCLSNNGIGRPSMSDVVWSLEFAMQLQDAAENRGDGLAEDYDGSPLFSPYPILKHGEPTTTDEDDMFSVSSNTAAKLKFISTSNENSDALKSSSTSSAIGERLKSENVFSEIKSPTGR